MTSNMPAIRLMTWNINKLSGQIQRDPRSSAAEIGVKRAIGDFLAQDDSPAIIVLQEGCGADCDPAGKFIEWLGSLDGCSVFAGSENRYIRTVVLSRGVHAELAECNKDLSRANRYVALNIDMGDKILHLLALHANANKDNGEIADDDIAARLCECGIWADDVALVLVGDANAAPKYRERLKREWGAYRSFRGQSDDAPLWVVARCHYGTRHEYRECRSCKVKLQRSPSAYMRGEALIDLHSSC